MGPFEAERGLRRALGRPKARPKAAPWRAPRARTTGEASQGIPPLLAPSDDRTAIVAAPPIEAAPAPASAGPEAATAAAPAPEAVTPDGTVVEPAAAVPDEPDGEVEWSPGHPRVGRVTDHPRAGRATGQQAESAAVPDRRRTRRLILLVAISLEILLIVLLGIAFALRDTGRPAPSTPTATPGGTAASAPGATPQSAAAAPPAAPTTAAATPGGALPVGWHYYKDGTGFTVAVPDGWIYSRRDGIVYFRDPQGNRLLGIDQTNQPKQDPVADWRGQESRRVAAGDFPGYQLIGIRPVDYHVRAADWEFTFNTRGGKKHVINRGAIFGDHQAYGFYWETPADQWDANLPSFDLITRTFQGRT
jgi:hypothetical protein